MRVNSVLVDGVTMMGRAVVQVVAVGMVEAAAPSTEAAAVQVMPSPALPMLSIFPGWKMDRGRYTLSGSQRWLKAVYRLLRMEVSTNIPALFAQVGTAQPAVPTVERSPVTGVTTTAMNKLPTETCPASLQSNTIRLRVPFGEH